MCNKLGVGLKEKKDIINKIFKDQLMLNHPDKFQGADPETLKKKEAFTTELILAYRFVELYRKERNTWN